MSAYSLGLKTFDAPPSDPLDRLDADALRLLYYDARAELLRTLPPATCALIRRGRCLQLVVARMRAIRASSKEHMYDSGCDCDEQFAE